ncbi:hypothetical protein AOLI_G00251710 [Acnodon oligacanthus]
MSWYLCLWIAVSCLVLCQATLYETIQQHHVPRPGRNAIQILVEDGLCRVWRVESLHCSITCSLTGSALLSHDALRPVAPLCLHSAQIDGALIPVSPFCSLKK